MAIKSGDYCIIYITINFAPKKIDDSYIQIMEDYFYKILIHWVAPDLLKPNLCDFYT